jgi:hypothetical protein
MIQDKIFLDEKDPTGLSYNTPFTVFGSYGGRLWSKTPSGEIKYYTQNSDLSVYATTGSNSFNGNQTVTGSLTVTEGITGTATTASYVEYAGVANKPTLVSGSAQITYSEISSIPEGIVSSSAQVGGYGIFATTGSNQFNGSQAITGSLTVTGQVVAQTLNVQQVTSSIVYSSGSNIFGNNSGNTHQFTGSVSVTGSMTVNGPGTFASSVTVGNNLLINNLTASKKGYTYQSPASNWGPQVSGLYFTPNNATDAKTTFTLELWNGIGSIITPLTIADTGTATFTGDVTVHSGLGTSVLNIGGTNGDYASAINLIGNNTFKNWQVGSNTGVQGSLEIRSSTVVGGTSFTTPVFSLSTTGAATFSCSVGVGAGMSIGTTGTNNISWNTSGGIRLSRTNIGPEDTLTQRWTGTLAYVDIAASSQWNGGVTILPNGGGNVGIGTATTIGLLTLGKAGGGQYISARDNTTGYEIGYLQFNSDNITLNPQGGASGNDSYIRLLTSSTERVRITSEGYLGTTVTNTTVSAGDLLGVLSFVSRDASTYSSGGITNIRSYATTTYNTGNVAGDLRFYVSDGLQNTTGTYLFGTEAMRITSGGNVVLSNTIQLNGTITNVGTGGGVYTQSVWYNDPTNQVLFENGRQTDSAAGTGRTVYFTWRGGPNVGGGVQLQHGTNAWAAYTSDARLKTKVADIENGIEAVMKLNPIKFKWSRELESSRTVIGFTAQNVEEAIPDAVFNSWKDEELGDVKSYYSDYLIPYLVKAIQELKSENNVLKSILERNNIS